jgi:3-phosphoglycerate kinase
MHFHARNENSLTIATLMNKIKCLHDNIQIMQNLIYYLYDSTKHIILGFMVLLLLKLQTHHCHATILEITLIVQCKRILKFFKELDAKRRRHL